MVNNSVIEMQAAAEQAQQNLRIVGRNLDLIDRDALDKAAKEIAALKDELATERATTAGLQGLIDQERHEHEATIAELQSDAVKEQGDASDEPMEMWSDQRLLDELASVDSQREFMERWESEVAKVYAHRQIERMRSNRG
jgi:hypothetical protein